MSTETDEIRIYISGPNGWGKWFRRLVGGSTMILGPIVIGIICDSSAMQWVGFVGGFLLLIVVSQHLSSATTFKTTVEARAYLDKIDAGTAP